MNQLLAWLSRAFSSWKFWIVVAPWDAGVLVRLGKTGTLLGPGFHWRVPLLDEITIVNTRLRFVPVTVALQGDGPTRCRTLTVQVGFRVTDPLVGMKRYGQPQAAVGALAQEAVLLHRTDTSKVKEALAGLLGGSGIDVETVAVIEDVEIRALRIVQSGINTGYWDNGQTPSVGGPEQPMQRAY